MRRTNRKAGLTLVEVLIAMFLVSMAAVIVYTEMLTAYRILARSRARLEAQSIAFDNLWIVYNTPLTNLPPSSTNFYQWRLGVDNLPTPEWSMMSTGGWVSCHILAETNPPVLPDPVWYWDIVVTVWPPTNTMLQIGTNPLSRCAIRRYRGER